MDGEQLDGIAFYLSTNNEQKEVHTLKQITHAHQLLDYP